MLAIIDFVYINKLQLTAAVYSVMLIVNDIFVSFMMMKLK